MMWIRMPYMFTSVLPTMTPTDIPDYSLQKVGPDLFQLKSDTYLSLVDYYSWYPKFQALHIISALKTIVVKFSIPVVSESGQGVHQSQ